MKKIRKRLLATLLSVAMGAGVFQGPVYAQEVKEPETAVVETVEPTEIETNIWDGNTTESVYENENYKVTYTLASYWETGYNANVKIENTGDSDIQNWYLCFDYTDEITNIWNAEISEHNENQYIIKNAVWNQDIAVGGCVEFGFSANQAFTGFPESYELIGSSKEVKEDDYFIQYHLDSDWGSGFTATVTVTNNTDAVLEDWTLEFDYAREITHIWNGVIESYENGHYVIKNAGYNANIAVGESISFGFNGVGGTSEDEPVSYSLYSYKYDDESPKTETDLALDSDEDGAEDYIEEYFGTDTKVPDTDGDGLSDFIELYSLVLDPLSKDTDKNGVEDGAEDLDGDGLSNILEVQLDTSILEMDTDEDGLNDFEEYSVYTTSPTHYDTDGDVVSDGKEIEIGTNPLLAQESFHIQIASKEEDTVKASVEIEVSGSQVQSVNVEKYENEFFFPTDMPGYIGGAYDFSVDGEFDTATIQFEFDESLLENASFEPVIYYFNEEQQTLEELETVVDGNVASAKVTHFSKYILLNRRVFQNSFEWQDVWSTTGYTGVEVVLVIDDSGSMSTNDSSAERLTVAKNLIDKLPENSKVGIVKFTDVTYELTSTVIEDKELAKSYLTTQYFHSSGGTYMYYAINSAIPMFESNDESIMKMIVVLSDGETGDTGAHFKVIQNVNRNDIKVFTVGLGSISIEYFTRYLKPLAKNTAGAFYLASNAGELEDIYNDINKKIDIETDSDNDGIADYYEDNMLMFNGVTIKLDKNNPDSDNDGLLDGEEVAELNYRYNADKTKVIVTGKLISNPLKIDSDDDGLTDEEELFYYFTPCLKPDSDGDGLTDKFEIEQWYDPFNADPDGDGRIDSLEYLEGTSPYEYDKKWYEHTWDFICGFVAGDFIAETDSMAVVAGQILSSCIPYVDIRDVAGNLVNGDYMFAGLSALGLVPIAGDTAKAVSKIGRFAIKNLDNVAKVADVVEFTSKYYPDAVKLLAKNDDFVSAAKAMSNNTSLKMTKKDAERINKILEDAGLSEYVIKGSIKSGKELIRNIRKVEYGADELSKEAIKFRKVNNMTSARRNVCVVEYQNAEGEIARKTFVSNASNHSEELMIEYLKADNISGENVIKIFTEREPCVETATNVGHNCANRIIEYTPDAEVTYAVDYGVTPEEGANARNILQGLLKNLLD